MKTKVFLFTIQIIALAFLLNRIFGFVEVPNSDYIFTGYLLLAVFTLPSLISKLIFKGELFGFTTALNFLNYPVIYVIIWFIARNTDASFMQLSTIAAYGLIFYWHYLFTLFLVFNESEYIQAVLKKVLFLALPVLGYLLFIFLPLRDPGSLVALDYLQHKTVVNEMAEAQHLCVVPSQCSNLFLQEGYTTIYHSILRMMWQGTGVSFEIVSYMLDLAFPILMAAVFYKIMFKQLKSHILAAVGTTFALLIFEDFAYTAFFFIPQTFAYFLFLNILSSEKLNPFKLFAAFILLTAAHFIMGPFLSVLLIVFYTLVSKYLASQSLRADTAESDKKHHFWINAGILLLAFIAFINRAEFSIERSFQTSETEAIGGVTNLYYPENFLALWDLFGLVTIILAIAIFFLIRYKSKSKYEWFALASVYISLLIYFLAPTYASKFLIGVGFWGSLLIMSYFKEIKLRADGVLILGALTLVLGANVNLQYYNYLSFYRHSDETSAITAADRGAIDFLNNDFDGHCIILSDPYSQLVLSAETNLDSARAQYMSLKSRLILAEFLEEPTSNTLADLLEIPELEGRKDICFVYSSRLETALKNNDKIWLENVYNYILDNETIIAKQPEAGLYLRQRGFQPIYRDKFNIIYELE